ENHRSATFVRHHHHRPQPTTINFAHHRPPITIDFDFATFVAPSPHYLRTSSPSPLEAEVAWICQVTPSPCYLEIQVGGLYGCGQYQIR
ncbi:hypothetical protein Drorol1_Dr00002691, partial [Drosera rotundifolia]